MRQRAVMRLEPSRGVTAVSSVVMALLGVALVVASRVVTFERLGGLPPGVTGGPSLEPDTLFTTAMLCFGIVFLVAGVIGAVVNGRRWRLHRRLVRLSRDPAFAGLMPDESAAPTRAVSRAVPPLRVLQVRDRKLPNPRNLQRVTAERNVVGLPPLRIGYLRLFENLPRSRTFIEGAWREFGPVYLLRSAGSVTPAELRAVRDGRPESVFLRSAQDVADAFDGSRPTVLPKGRRAFKSLAHTTIRTRDKYGSYAPVAPLCHGATWRSAVDVVLDTVDLVVLDLSGFSPRNDGTAYELQRVIDRYPVERLLVIVDPRSDVRYLEGVIQDAWHRMAAGSPNEGRDERVLLVAATDVWRVIMRQTGGAPAGGAPGATPGAATGQAQQTPQTRLVANRRQTRRLAAWLQAELGHRVESSARAGTDAGVTAVADPRLSSAAVGSGDRAGAWRGIAAALAILLALAGGAYAISSALGNRATQGRSQDVASTPTGPGDPSSSSSPPPSSAATPPETLVQVPGVTGRSLDDAEGDLKAAGLRVGEVTKRPSLDVAAGTVLESSPAAGVEVEAETKVALVVASGAVVVPNVVGGAPDDATAELEQAGFTVEMEDGCAGDDSVAVGTVCASKPAAGELAGVGSTVRLTLRAEPEPPPPPGGGGPTPPVTSTSPTAPPPPTETVTATLDAGDPTSIVPEPSEVSP